MLNETSTSTGSGMGLISSTGSMMNGTMSSTGMNNNNSTNGGGNRNAGVKSSFSWQLGAAAIAFSLSAAAGAVGML